MVVKKFVPLLLVVLVVAALAGLEFLHELGDEPGVGATMCTDPATQRSSMADLLLMHLHGHR